MAERIIGAEFFVSLRQNGGGADSTRANANLPKGHRESAIRSSVDCALAATEREKGTDVEREITCQS
jgi:hypothetical protein